MSRFDRDALRNLAAALGRSLLLVAEGGRILWSTGPLPVPDGEAGLTLGELFLAEGGAPFEAPLLQALEQRKLPPIVALPGPRLAEAAAGERFALDVMPHGGGGDGEELLVLVSPERRPPLPSPEPCAGSTVRALGRHLLSLMPFGVMVVDQEARIRLVSLRAASGFGYRVNELEGRHLADLVAPADRMHLIPAILSADRSPSQDPIHFHILRANGTLALAEFVGHGYLAEGGQRYTVANIRDITRQTRRQALDRVRHVGTAVATFAAGLAAELQLLLEPGTPAPPTPQESAPQLAGVRDLVRRLQTIGGVAPEKPALVPTDLNEVILAAEQELRPVLGQRTWLRAIPAADLPPVLGSPERLTQMVRQLCLNAEQAMPLGGHVLLRTDYALVDEEVLFDVLDARPGAYVVLTIQDDGVGMDPQVLDRIFEPYFTTHAGDQPSGLGLAIVHAIVREHRGFITAESQPGRGTRFRIYFPASCALPTDGGVPANRPPERWGGTVLLLDDGFGIRSTLQPLLSRAGCRVVVVGRDERACEVLGCFGEELDAVVVDVTGPHAAPCRGVLERFRTQRSDLKLLIVGDRAAQKELKEALGAENTVYLDAHPTGMRLRRAMQELQEGR